MRRNLLVLYNNIKDLDPHLVLHILRWKEYVCLLLRSSGCIDRSDPAFSQEREGCADLNFSNQR